MQDGDALIGSWRLESFELRASGGEVSHPYGEALVGYLFYNADGFMSAAFMSARRGRADESDLARAAETSSYDEFTAYTGPYEVMGDRVVHHVEVASLEALVGSRQERWWKVDGERLELLTAPLDVAGDVPVGRLVWHRVKNEAPAA
jgi:hypothetical protein